MHAGSALITSPTVVTVWNFDGLARDSSVSPCRSRPKIAARHGLGAIGSPVRG